jgi:predicted nucleic acid-binding protein
MNLVLDNNILFSIMNPESMNSFIFEYLDLKFFAPVFIIKEFEKYKDNCFKKSGLSRRNFEDRKKEIFSRINFVELSEFRKFVEGAKDFCPDKDDVFYFGLCLKLDLSLWSNDKLLKEQKEVLVLDTRDVIDLLL